MRPDLFWIDRSFPGRLAVTARPRGGLWLQDELLALRDAGVDILVSALVAAEILALELDDEEQAAAEAGVQFVSLPIEDRLVPPLGRVAPVLSGLAGAVRSGRHVAVHCRVGLGRSPLIVGSLLVLLGERPDEAWRLVSAARGCPVPETAEQRAWIGQLARSDAGADPNPS